MGVSSKKLIEKAINKQHLQMIWLALAVNIVATTLIYIYFLKDSIVSLIVGCAISVTIIFGVFLKKKKLISAQFLGLIPMVSMSIYFAYVYHNLVRLQLIREFTYFYMGIFIGGGMFLLLKFKQTIPIIILTLIANAFFYYHYSFITINELLFNGGLAVFLMASFMVISIYMRHRLVIKNAVATKKIINSEKQNRLLFNQNPYPNLIYSLNDLSILDVNEAMIEHYGYTKKEFLSMDITQLRPKEDLEKLHINIADVKKGVEKAGEWVHILKNGEQIHVEISAKGIDYHGIKARLVLIKDITDSKIYNDKLESTLKTLEDYKIAIDNHAIVAITDANGIITYVNDNFCEISQYSKKELIGQDHKIINSGFHSKEFFKEMYNTIGKGNTFRAEVKNKAKDGSFYWVDSTITPFVDKKTKKPIQYIVIRKDITESKQEKKELRIAKEEAVKSKENQSMFLSNMSHEIRTPMNGIIGMSRLLKNTNLNKEQQKYNNAIFTSADNLMHIINEILDVSKVEAGKMEIENIPFNLIDLIKTWQEILSIRADEQSLKFIIETEENLPTKLIGDPIRLNQIIYNLVGNGLKFTSKGEVTLSIKMIELLKNDVTIQFDVIDTGIGIPEDKLEEIFLSFSQANRNTTRKYGGTGLGLTITKNLIDLQNGKITVDSTEGKGSTFSFALNYGIHNASSSSSSSSSSRELNDIGLLDILLVEDHEINQMLATNVLEGWGFNVELARNGIEAVEMADKNRYDLIIMDIHMPIMDGYEATQKIRTELKSDIPIIAMTASARIGDNKRCFEVGMDDFISKPFDPDLLIEKIVRYTKKKAS
jgi:PAS domain S-box-containing protein